MVTHLSLAAVKSGMLLAGQTDPVIERLDPPRRAAVLMALLALVLVGLFLVMFVMIGGHWVRRLARQKPNKRGNNGAEALQENHRLRDSLQSVLPEAKTDDTIHVGKLPKDTKLDL
jgi:predicted PurR-regulated permease PerM